MLNKKIETIIIKYFSKSASINEMIVLNEWIEKNSNDLLFRDYLKTNYLINMNMLDFDTEKEKERILERIKIQDKKSRLKKLHHFFKYAAIFITVIGIGYLVLNNHFSSQRTQQQISTISADTLINTGIDKAILTLENGTKVVLEKDNFFQTKNAQSNGEKIVYKKSNQNLSKVTYNYLTIPRGGQFFVQLSDGTKIWLNSESQLKYPVVFPKGKLRKVTLVYGEAYFEVSPSTKHHGTKFKVFHQQQEIEVLGTEFNVKAYKDETQIYTTLVDGKISLQFENYKKDLVPNQQAMVDIKRNTLLVKTVDVYNEIAWKDGVFSFEGKSLKNIMKVLSRWYDIDVKFNNKELEEEEFNGSLGKDQPIEEILSSIKNFGTIKKYEIKNKKVILE